MVSPVGLSGLHRNAATVDLQDLVTGEHVLQAVAPEAQRHD